MILQLTYRVGGKSPITPAATNILAQTKPRFLSSSLNKLIALSSRFEDELGRASNGVGRRRGRDVPSHESFVLVANLESRPRQAVWTDRICEPEPPCFHHVGWVGWVEVNG